ncbi:MAG: chemotaxis protein CheR [Myxococcales bacterium]|nr:chemotaxis protein CheR [Myxococcales bacterium]
MKSSLFDRFRSIAYQQAGIRLSDGKRTLVAARVGRRLRALGIPDHASYLDYLEADTSGDELVHFLDAISTNFTSFYREPDHFELLAAHLRERLDAGQRKIRIWCAASSSGEEPYSIAITVREICGDDVDVMVLATDISTRMLERARAGVYDRKRIDPVPTPILARYFERRGRHRSEDERFVVRDSLRQLVVLKRLNLARPPYPMHGPLDFIFIRNVLMYFDNAVRARISKEIVRLLHPTGFAVVGHSETLSGVAPQLLAASPSVYQLVSSARPQARRC